MPERSFPSQSKRALDVIMTEEDDASFTEVLRQNISPLLILCVDFRQETIEVLDSLASYHPGECVYITSPDPGDDVLDRLRTALLFSGKTESQIFRNALPRRQAQYVQSRYINTGMSKDGDGGQPVELFNYGRFLFSYDRTDAEAHRFTNKVLRLLKRMLVNRFALEDPKTRRLVHLDWSIYSRWAGPGALESCRRHPRRYLEAGPIREGSQLFLAPLPPEMYEKPKTRKPRD